MRLLQILGVSGFCAVVLAGCQSTLPEKDVERTPWKTEVSRKSSFETVHYGTGHTALPGKDHQNLRNLIAKAEMNSPVYARLLLNIPETKSKDDLTQKRVADLKRHLREWGVASHRIDVTYLAPHKVVTLSAKNKNSVSVVIDQYDVRLPECPGWNNMGDVTLPQGEQQFGCVTERNFAQMVAEPRDLYESQTLGKRDGIYNAKAIEKYRGEDSSKSGDKAGIDLNSLSGSAPKA